MASAFDGIIRPLALCYLLQSSNVVATDTRAVYGLPEFSDHFVASSRGITAIALNEKLAEGSADECTVLSELFKMPPKANLNMLLKEKVHTLVPSLNKVRMAVTKECGEKGECVNYAVVSAGIGVVTNLDMNPFNVVKPVLQDGSPLHKAMALKTALEDLSQRKFSIDKLLKTLEKKSNDKNEVAVVLSDLDFFLESEEAFNSVLSADVNQQAVLDGIDVLLKLKPFGEPTSDINSKIKALNDELSKIKDKINTLSDALPKALVDEMDRQLTLIRVMADPTEQGGETMTGGFFNGVKDLDGIVAHVQSPFVLAIIPGSMTKEQVPDRLKSLEEFANDIKPLRAGMEKVKFSDGSVQNMAKLQGSMKTAAEKISKELSVYLNLYACTQKVDGSVKFHFSDLETAKQKLSVLDERLKDVKTVLEGHKSVYEDLKKLKNAVDSAGDDKKVSTLKDGLNGNSLTDKLKKLKEALEAKQVNELAAVFVNLGKDLFSEDFKNWARGTQYETLKKCLNDNGGITQASVAQNDLIGALKDIISLGNTVESEIGSLAAAMEEWEKLKKTFGDKKKGAGGKRKKRRVKRQNKSETLLEATQAFAGAAKVTRALHILSTGGIEKVDQLSSNIDGKVGKLTDPTAKDRILKLWTVETKNTIKKVPKVLQDVTTKITEPPKSLQEFGDFCDRVQVVKIGDLNMRDMSHLFKLFGDQQINQIFGPFKDVVVHKPLEALKLASLAIPNIVTFLDVPSAVWKQKLTSPNNASGIPFDSQGGMQVAMTPDEPPFRSVGGKYTVANLSEDTSSLAYITGGYAFARKFNATDVNIDVLVGEMLNLGGNISLASVETMGVVELDEHLMNFTSVAEKECGGPEGCLNMTKIYQSEAFDSFDPKSHAEMKKALVDEGIAEMKVLKKYLSALEKGHEALKDLMSLLKSAKKNTDLEDFRYQIRHCLKKIKATFEAFNKILEHADAGKFKNLNADLTTLLNARNVSKSFPAYREGFVSLKADVQHVHNKKKRLSKVLNSESVGLFRKRLEILTKIIFPGDYPYNKTATRWLPGGFNDISNFKKHLEGEFVKKVIGGEENAQRLEPILLKFHGFASKLKPLSDKRKAIQLPGKTPEDVLNLAKMVEEALTEVKNVESTSSKFAPLQNCSTLEIPDELNFGGVQHAQSLAANIGEDATAFKTSFQSNQFDAVGSLIPKITEIIENGETAVPQKLNDLQDVYEKNEDVLQSVDNTLEAVLKSKFVRTAKTVSDSIPKVEQWIKKVDPLVECIMKYKSLQPEQLVQAVMKLLNRSNPELTWLPDMVKKLEELIVEHKKVRFQKRVRRRSARRHIDDEDILFEAIVNLADKFLMLAKAIDSRTDIKQFLANWEKMRSDAQKISDPEERAEALDALSDELKAWLTATMTKAEALEKELLESGRTLEEYNKYANWGFEALYPSFKPRKLAKILRAINIKSSSVVGLLGEHNKPEAASLQNIITELQLFFNGIFHINPTTNIARPAYKMISATTVAAEGFIAYAVLSLLLIPVIFGIIGAGLTVYFFWTVYKGEKEDRRRKQRGKGARKQRSKFK